MGNSLSGDVTRLTSFGAVKTPRRFIKYPPFSQTPLAGILKDIKGLAQCLPAATCGGKGGAL